MPDFMIIWPRPWDESPIYIYMREFRWLVRMFTHKISIYVYCGLEITVVGVRNHEEAQVTRLLELMNILVKSSWLDQVT